MIKPVLLLLTLLGSLLATAADRPNLVIFFTDDQG